MKLEVHHRRLNLKQPFVLSYGTFYYRDSLILALSENGVTGFGEATAISYLGMDLPSLQYQLTNAQKLIESLTLDHPEKLYSAWMKIFPKHSFLRSAMDCACWDWYGKVKGAPVYDIIEQTMPAGPLPLSSYTLSGTPDTIREGLADISWPILKIKMGQSQDEDILDVLKEYAGSSELRIDANGGWSVSRARQMASRLCKMGIRWVEQPLPKDQWQLMSELQDVKVSWIADESLTNVSVATQIVSLFDGFNAKLMKSGGITPTLTLISFLRTHNKLVALGCMTESSFGISAAAQIAGLVDAIDMDGNILIANDPGIGARLDQGRIIRSESAGIGCRWQASYDS